MINNRIEIMKWLNACKVKDYTVHEDSLIVDVDNDVDLFNLNLTEIPLQFGIVKGYFDCSKNHLTSLKGMPHTLHGHFNCAINNLTVLDCLPEKIPSYIYAAFNPIDNIYNLTCQFERNFYHNDDETNHKIKGLEEFYIADERDRGIEKLCLSYKEMQSIILNHKFNDSIMNKTIITNNKKIKI